MNQDHEPQLHIPRGFSFSAATAGIKASGKPDLALAIAAKGTSAAAVFTSNRVVAAPIEVGREHLAWSRGKIRAVVVNSGNANCATGKAGYAACKQICSVIGENAGVPIQQVFPSSTGIIGVPFPAEKILAHLPQLMAQAEASEKAVRAFVGAIMTTDLRPKLASAQFKFAGKPISILGIAKGAGMIHPQMATMLVYLFTDVQASPSLLKTHLREAVDGSLNCISIDGDTSTNDTALLLASGSSGVALQSASARARFRDSLAEVCRSLATQIVADGEGVRHVVRLLVQQARSGEEADRVARTIAHSLLVKTAWAGADPNWGRILAAIGNSGVRLDPARVNIFFGKQQVCRKGEAVSFDEHSAHVYLSQPRYEITIQLGRGKSHCEFLTCDLTTEYVHINADYST
ncbi:MAG TPA: bifunctional glutamate N-acetyltransferase/amino-acid acetyltransferase ArgJ [Terriglobales bacterium]|nr:bifunctional glutamate N-acetyltransferase/amino-acid acetyltransferase ArgJ [Terriglobales bacterium]